MNTTNSRWLCPNVLRTANYISLGICGKTYSPARPKISDSALTNRVVSLTSSHIITEDESFTVDKLKKIIAITHLLAGKIFDPMRFDGYAYIGDSPLAKKQRDLFFLLQGKSFSDITTIIQYEFQKTNQFSDEEIRAFIRPLALTVYSGNEGELCRSADLTLPVKAKLLHVIEELKLPFISNLDKKIFFIKFLSTANLEIDESTFIKFKKLMSDPHAEKVVYQGRTTYYKDKDDLFGITDHPFLHYKEYPHYVNARYFLIHQYENLQLITLNHLQ